MAIREVTVFGGSGFVGRSVVRAFARAGARVRVAARRLAFVEATRTAGEVGQVVPVIANLRMPDSVRRAAEGSQVVVNAAGIPFQRLRQRYEAVHVAGAAAIAEAARAGGAERVIHISGLGADDRESRNPFIRSKVGAEGAIVAGFPRATILRPSVVFGPDDAMFNRMARIATTAPFLPLVGDGRARVQPIFVGDLAAAVVAAATRPETAGMVFELGGPQVFTYREIAALVLRQIGRDKPVIGVPAALMTIGGWLAEFLPVPPITADQVGLLTQDNVVRAGVPGLAELGVAPTSVEAILPTYLDRFRAGGRYNREAPV